MNINAVHQIKRKTQSCQIGQTILGQDSGSGLGSGVSLTADGFRYVVGARDAPNDTSIGYANVYEREISDNYSCLQEQLMRVNF